MKVIMGGKIMKKKGIFYILFAFLIMFGLKANVFAFCDYDNGSYGKCSFISYKTKYDGSLSNTSVGIAYGTIEDADVKNGGSINYAAIKPVSGWITKDGELSSNIYTNSGGVFLMYSSTGNPPIGICKNIKEGNESLSKFLENDNTNENNTIYRKYVYFTPEQVDNAISSRDCLSDDILFSVNGYNSYKTNNGTQTVCDDEYSNIIYSVDYGKNESESFSVKASYHGGICNIVATNGTDKSIKIDRQMSSESKCSSELYSVKCKGKDSKTKTCSLVECQIPYSSDGVYGKTCTSEKSGTKCEYKNENGSKNMLFYNINLDKMIKYTDSKENPRTYDSVQLASDNGYSFFWYSTIDDVPINSIDLSRNDMEKGLKAGEECAQYIVCDKNMNCLIADDDNINSKKEKLSSNGNLDTFSLKKMKNICDENMDTLVDYIEGKTSEKANNYTSYKPICGIFKKDGKLLPIIKNIYKIFKIALPVLILILTIVEFLKVLFSGEDKTMKDAFKATTTRLILLVVVVLSPILIEFIIRIAGVSENCLQYFVK